MRLLLKDIAETSMDPVIQDDFNGHDYVNDIALLHLESPFIIDEVTTNRICLPAVGADYSDQAATITGWGYTVEDGGSFSDVLQEAVVQTITDQACRDSNYNENYIYDHHICAAAEGADACAGDAGGPLMVKTKIFFVLGNNFFKTSQNFRSRPFR